MWLIRRITFRDRFLTCMHNESCVSLIAPTVPESKDIMWLIRRITFRYRVLTRMHNESCVSLIAPTVPITRITGLPHFHVKLERITKYFNFTSISSYLPI